jgi:hypothetical protein
MVKIKINEYKDMSMKYKKQMLLGCVWLAVSSGLCAEGLKLNAGIDYSRGKYGTSESTDVTYMPFSAEYTTGALSYKLTVPMIRVTGNGTVIPGGLGDSSGGGGVGSFGCASDSRKGAGKVEDSGLCAGTAAASSTGRTTTSGVGDVLAGVTYNVIDNSAKGVVVDLAAKVKFGTASESKNLGSGENDYALQGYAEKSWGAVSVSVGVGYKWLGRSTGAKFDGVKFGSFGGEYKLSNDSSMGIGYDWASARVAGGIRPKEFSLYGSQRLNKNYKLNAVLYRGLSDASPDGGGTVSVSYNW